MYSCKDQEGHVCIHVNFGFLVDVGEETPRTVCSGLVGSVPLEELQVRMELQISKPLRVIR